jgi:hypothetical protein
VGIVHVPDGGAALQKVAENAFREIPSLYKEDIRDIKLHRNHLLKDGAARHISAARNTMHQFQLSEIPKGGSGVIFAGTLASVFGGLPQEHGMFAAVNKLISDEGDGTTFSGYLDPSTKSFSVKFTSGEIEFSEMTVAVVKFSTVEVTLESDGAELRVSLDGPGYAHLNQVESNGHVFFPVRVHGKIANDGEASLVASGEMEFLGQRAPVMIEQHLPRYIGNEDRGIDTTAIVQAPEVELKQILRRAPVAFGAHLCCSSQQLCTQGSNRFSRPG